MTNIESRIDELMSRMTLEEIIMQTDQYFSHDFTRRDEQGRVEAVDIAELDSLLRGMSCGSIQARGMRPEQINEIQRYALEKTRLGIPFLFSEEALHGLGHPDATVFPQQIGLAATFNPELGYRMGRAIGTETRAMGIHETYSPVMDLIRDPRYGRTEETYGEDTFLGAEFAREVVKGLQGDDLSRDDAIASEPKHYAGYGAPVGGLNCAPCAMGRREVFSDALPIFEAAFKDAGATDAMCSYNAIDGIPVASDRELLTDVLRGQWGMRGFVRSDLTAVARLYDNHYTAPTRKEAIAMGLEAGVDLQLYDFPHDEWQNGIKEMVESGRLDRAVVEQACRRVLRVKFLLGLFDRPYVDTALSEKRVHSPEHRSLSRSIARESIVLLKNEDHLLPLSRDIKTIAVLGPGANRPMLGDYVDPAQTGDTLLEGIRALVSEDTEILYDEGCNFLGDAAIPFPRKVLFDENGAPGLTGRYYNGREFAGVPVMTRTDPRIDFNWIYSKPCSEVDAYCFSVRWTGRVVPDESFAGYIGFNTQDSMRLYVDGKLILDSWGEKKDANRTVGFEFVKGRSYDIVIEFTNDRRGARVVFGYNRTKEDFTRAVELAKRADVAVICAGDSQDTSGENFDRVSLDLAGNQTEFIKRVAATGTPVVLVLETGRPASIVWEEENIPAILEAWFPGEEGGHAVAETLFGLNAPSGRLPISFPKTVGQIPCHYTRRPGGGRRYVEMDWLPLYPFGYGLGYTQFTYSNLSLSAEKISAGESITACFDVTNTGEAKGTAVPQVYIRDMVSSTVKPLMALAAFSKVPLESGQTKRVCLSVSPRSMRTLGTDFVWRVEPGEFRLILASDSEHPIESRTFTVA
ncbi:MAG: glycoside hydrolase family 3 C-terminal domain-containing protein [Clostridiales bacterium]|nr:glycoside hydrolase family 3 C-terminal domain-containing protein [Clostridiales bacterium]